VAIVRNGNFVIEKSVLSIYPKSVKRKSKNGKGKGKAISLQSWTDPDISRRLRLPDFKTIVT